MPTEDFFKRILHVGDIVAAPLSSENQKLGAYVITEFTPRMIKLHPIKMSDDVNKSGRREYRYKVKSGYYIGRPIEERTTLKNSRSVSFMMSSIDVELGSEIPVI